MQTGTEEFQIDTGGGFLSRSKAPAQVSAATAKPGARPGAAPANGAKFAAPAEAIPIIIVSSAPTALLSLYNIKEFLEDGVYVALDKLRCNPFGERWWGGKGILWFAPVRPWLTLPCVQVSVLSLYSTLAITSATCAAEANADVSFFFCQCRYMTVDEVKQKGGKKPASVTITRDVKGKKTTFLVVDNTTKFKPQDWYVERGGVAPVIYVLVSQSVF